MFQKNYKKEYNDYLSSFEWYRKREVVLKAANYKCKRCGRKRGKAVKLEVHHLTYKRFGREQPEDLEIVCQDCHYLADAEREQGVKQKNANKLCAAQLDGWASKVYEEDWADTMNVEAVAEKFYEWLEVKGE